MPPSLVQLTINYETPILNKISTELFLKCGAFFIAQNHHAENHVSPQNHHNFTTITRQKTRTFSKTPTKNTQKTTKFTPPPRQKKICKETGLG
jgi:hypothetical protein